jgi:hypothetical protein
MKRLIAILLLATAAFAQTATTLANIRQIYVEPMPNNLNQYLTSEISKQFHGSMTIVTKEADADAIMKGINLGAQNTTLGTVQLVDKSGNTILWSGTASDRDKKFLSVKHGGEQKMAANLIGELEKAMQPK